VPISTPYMVRFLEYNGEECVMSGQETSDNMPTISRFYGIAIRMYFDDHPRPHFHAYSAGEDASISIDTLEILEGGLSRRGLALVLEWASEHRGELRDNWARCEAHQQLREIDPLV
jgi:hypothetical protein